MKQLEVHLKSGGTFTVDATDLSITRNRVTGVLTEIEWTTPEDFKRKLVTLRVEDIAALVVIS